MRIDPALTYFRARHYHRPWLLDCRVRKGNGYFQPGMGTGRRFGEASGRIREGTSSALRRQNVGLVERDRRGLQ